MNDFDEDKWSIEQRELDGRIALDVEALYGSHFTYHQTDQPTEAWLASAKEIAAEVFKRVAQIDHAGRRQYWAERLAALGLSETPAPAPVAEAAPEPEPEPAASNTLYTPKRGRGKGEAPA